MAAAAEEGLVTSAHDLSDGGLLVALAEGVLRFGVGARVWLTELMERDGIDVDRRSLRRIRRADARLRRARRRREIPRPVRGAARARHRIGVTDAEVDGLELQNRFTLSHAELHHAHRDTLPARFGAVVGG